MLCASPRNKYVTFLLRVIEVAWSPHREGQLVSVSYDFSAQVWDLATRAPTHNFQVSGFLISCFVCVYVISGQW